MQDVSDKVDDSNDDDVGDGNNGDRNNDSYLSWLQHI